MVDRCESMTVSIPRTPFNGLGNSIGLKHQQKHTRAKKAKSLATDKRSH